MDPNGHIYTGDDNLIPAEDKARLDGYLRGRAESDAEKIAALNEKMETLEAAEEDARIEVARARGRAVYQRIVENNPNA